MEKQVINCRRSRAKAEIHSHGGRVTGWHKVLPIVYATHPFSDELWPSVEIMEVSGDTRQFVRVSSIDGCRVIWG
ncbi:hypothetical protein [Erwinia typographi]|uniref:hypothetical protein n=1 Tax=Erwinia typographi TaxID=371042 RepID=UPI000907AFF0|nr:hypothetical protein [Erwinia typographi]